MSKVSFKNNGVCIIFFKTNLEEISQLRELQSKTLENCRSTRKEMREFQDDVKKQVSCLQYFAVYLFFILKYYLVLELF